MTQPKTRSKPNAVRKARHAAGLSRERVAVDAGISIGTLSVAELTGYLTARTAEKLAPVLGVPVETLLAKGAQ